MTFWLDILFATQSLVGEGEGEGDKFIDFNSSFR